jgi:hypothetical protein
LTFVTVAGLNNVVATSTGLPNVTFNATTTGLPSGMVAFVGNNQAAVAGTAVPLDPAVRITDVNGQGAAGVQVSFTVTGGGGSVTGSLQTTDATGIATVGSWILGGGANNTLTATAAVPGLAGNPVTFSASAATQIAITTQPPANTTSGTNFTVVVQLRDANNVLSQVSNLQLVISIASGGGTLNAGTTGLSVMAVNGVATFNVNIVGGAGARTLQISGTGVGNVVTTSVTLP